MKEHPILFSAPMVRAILEGRKTQTRRVLKPQPAEAPASKLFCIELGFAGTVFPYGTVGHRLWVRETFAFYDDGLDGGLSVAYKADDGRSVRRWSPSIHMPRTESRITLEITDVRVQRVQDISEEDAFAEGVFSTGTLGRDYASCQDNFAELWDSINAKRAPWNSNPLVRAISFRRIEAGA